MATPLADIELQLKRARFENTVNDARKKLNADFDQLSPADALKLLKRILDPNDELAKSFLKLHRAIRLELLVKLPKLLGHMASESFYEHLTKTSDLSPPSKKLQEGLKQVFPDNTKALRDKFLSALRDQFSAAHTRPANADATIPGVMLEFRNDGPLSWDNKATSRTEVPGGRLGPHGTSGKNYMEIRGNVIGHRPGVQYQFKRTMEEGQWYRLAASKWTQWSHEGPDIDDDENDADEHLFPDHNHIYVFDGPGLIRIGPPEPESKDAKYFEITEAIRSNSLTDYVWIMNAVEWVEIRVNSSAAWVKGESLQWYTVTWLDKPKGESWRRAPRMNYIRKGSLGTLDLPEPPIS